MQRGKPTILLVLMLFCLSWQTSAQEITNDIEGNPRDSAFLVQFIALSDTARNFPELTFYGELVKEYLPDRGFSRFSIGYFSSRLEAEATLQLIRFEGYPDAFIRALPNYPALLVELFDEQEPVRPIGEPEIPSTETVEIRDDLEQQPTIPPVVDSEAEESPDSASTEQKMTILYTGKSLGLLGNTRFQSEHELLTKFALENDIEFKLVSHACWRSKGITIFLPSDEPEGPELDQILDKQANWEVLESYPALRTNNVVMFRGPDRDEVDMLDIILSSEKTPRAYPEIERIEIRIYRTIIDEDKECLIVEEEDAIWPSNRAHWNIGEINRVDYGKTARLYELPINQGNFDSRVTVLHDLDQESDLVSSRYLKVDLGHRNGDFDVSSLDRARADLEGLSRLGYDMVLPYEFELSLGPENLKELISTYPDISWIASNLESSDTALFETSQLRVIDSLKVGFIGLVEPDLETNLPGKILQTFKFKNPSKAAQDAVDELLDQGAEVIMALSNMSNDENAILAESVYGIDLIISDISSNGTPFNLVKEVQLPKRKQRGYGRPYHIANTYDYGIAVGRLDLTVVKDTALSRSVLTSITEKNYPVNDRIQADTFLVNDITATLNFATREKGELMFPAFIDIIEQEPSLAETDDITRNGRMSKSLWEQFIANLLRSSSPAEVSIVRQVPSFLPLIGKLHEREVRSWLWIEDDIVMMDMTGRDIRRLIESDFENQLVTSGIKSYDYPSGRFWFIMGRFLRDDVYYRVATTNILSEGPFEEHFRWALRKSDKFQMTPKGALKEDKDGEAIALRDYMLSEMKRIRGLGKGKTHHENIAKILKPPTSYEKLFTFNFQNPTLWTSINRSYKGEGYETVPESRIIAANSFVIGVQGGLITTLDKEKSAWDMGIRMAFAEQSADVGADEYQKTETMDDINFNLTYRYKGNSRKKLHPFARLEYDTEFTPTFNTSLAADNPRQKILRNVVGLSKEFSPRWPIVEFGVTGENDFALNHFQYGLQARTLGRFPLDKYWRTLYTLTNNFNYYFKTPNDTDRELEIKYNMVHELLVPLFGDLSLNVAADFFFFKGKTEINSDPGLSMLFRVGISYNRLWKPRFQSLF
jgi:hypothetical protein